MIEGRMVAENERPNIAFGIQSLFDCLIGLRGLMVEKLKPVPKTNEGPIFVRRGVEWATGNADIVNVVKCCEVVVDHLCRPCAKALR